MANSQLHIVMIPMMCPGHIIPMVDMAKLLTRNNRIKVTIITTPLNAARLDSMVVRAVNSGHHIEFLRIPFPAVEAGLPAGCESYDEIPSQDLVNNFFTAVNMFQEPVEKAYEMLRPSPGCVISDASVGWVCDLTKRFGIPWITFDGMSCFSKLCNHILSTTKVYESVPKSEPFVVPGLPDFIEFTRAQLPGLFNSSSTSKSDLRRKIVENESSAYGVVVNSFEELEQGYVAEYKKVRGKVWCIGPLSLCNKDNLDKAERGKKTLLEKQDFLHWLDKRPLKSVVYVCMGSLTRIIPQQLIEMALGFEASGHPFIWVMKEGNEVNEFRKWISENRFEERTRDRGLLIYGWSLQLIILSHPSVGAFLTHCGWNSTLEGISAGLPMITWPGFAEQFYNEKILVDILGTSVKVGAKEVVHVGEEEKFGITVTKEQIKDAIHKVMEASMEGNERRNRAKEYGEKGKSAIKEGGSSHNNLSIFIQDMIQTTCKT